MMTLRVNDLSVTVPQGSTVIQACAAAGVDVPRFCYHERLAVAGNCRRCLVEMEKSPKPVASCARPAAPNRVVFTDTPQVRKAREAVREFLLRHHPLDCPICDQGGECDLQDQARVFGADRSRSHAAPKRGVEDKAWGPLVKTVRTRCMQCTRCVRFASEMAGVADLGATGRGSAVEMGTYRNTPFLSELSANVMDLCPVGALTSNVAPFTFRPWELTAVDTVDRTDPRRLPVRVQRRGLDLRRVLPRTDEWLGDKARFAPLDYSQRLVDRHLVTCSPNASTATALRARAELVDSVESVRRIVSPALPESRARARRQAFAARRPTTVEVALPAPRPAPEDRPSTADLNLEGVRSVLLMHLDPRRSAPVFNAALRAAYLNGADRRIQGPAVDLGFPVRHLSLSLEPLDSLEAAAPTLPASATRVFVAPARLARARAVHGARFGVENMVALPQRANEAAYWRAPYAPLAAPKAPSAAGRSLLVLAAVTADQLAALGVHRERDLLAAHRGPRRAFHWVGAPWRTSFDALWPLPAPRSLEASWATRTRDEAPRRTTASRDAGAVGDAFAALLTHLGSAASSRPSAPAAAVAAAAVAARVDRALPRVHDYFREGHPRAETSPARAKASAYHRARATNFHG